MAKKKNQGKKHKFKHVPAATVGAVSGGALGGASGGDVSTPSAAVSGGAPARRTGVVAPAGRDFSYVGVDLRRIAILAASLVALELVLWYLFAHTGVGPSVYRLVQV